MVSDGWLLDDQQNQIHLCVTGEAIKFYKSKTANQEYRVKITPMDLRNRDVCFILFKKLNLLFNFVGFKSI